jgi:hypothetical protein
MKIDRIAYEQLYPTGVYANQRFRAEASVDPDDNYNLSACYQTLKDTVEKAFVALNPQIKWEEPKPDIVIQKDSKESATERMLTAINTCTEIKVLETFKLLVSKNPVFQEAYDNKLKSFQ